MSYFLPGDYCELSGTIPGPVLSAFTNLESLDLESTGITGQIPTQFGRLTKLRSLELSRNALTGGIPNQIGDLPLLESLELYDNQVSDSRHTLNT